MWQTAMFLVLIGLSTACGPSKPYLYGSDSCGEGQTAYVVTDGLAAVCMPKHTVSYLYCSRELGLVSSERSSTAKVSLNITSDPATGQGSAETVESLKSYFASEGRLAEARASAIEACVKLLDK